MVRLFDNTLRDGGNVVGHGFPISLTQSIIGAVSYTHLKTVSNISLETVFICGR